MSDMQFTIPGEPYGKGRPRFCRTGGFVKAYTPEKTASYEDAVRIEYMRQRRKHEGCSEKFFNYEPLAMEIWAYFSVPKSENKTVKTKMLSRAIRPTKKPDIDNIAKIIADSLNGIAYKDDSQIVEMTVHKFYSDEPRVEVVIDNIEK